MNATKSKRIIALLAAIVLSVGLSLAVSASSTTEPPLLGGNLIWNIESIYYYVDSSANWLFFKLCVKSKIRYKKAT